MIVLEGPDGSGKTTLLANLLDQFPTIEEHARASTSVGGPLPEIHDWAKQDLMTQMLQPLSFYDRHPMFSEPIYGRIIRDRVHDWFSSEESQLLGQTFIENSLIVVCLPKIENVVANTEENFDDQMSGVVDHIGEIYSRYEQLLRFLVSMFPANVFHYDYTVDTDLDDLKMLIDSHLTRHTRKKNGRLA